MTTLYKSGRPIDDVWRPAPEEGLAPNGIPTVLTLKQWAEQRAVLVSRDQKLGIRIEPGEPIESVSSDLERFVLVVLPFPKFADGRSFSKAKIIRDDHGFEGEIRAVGDVLWDQLQLMVRCGFDAFEISHEPTLQALSAGKTPWMTDFYQPGFGPETRLNTPRSWARRIATR